MHLFISDPFPTQGQRLRVLISAPELVVPNAMLADLGARFRILDENDVVRELDLRTPDVSRIRTVQGMTPTSAAEIPTNTLTPGAYVLEVSGTGGILLQKGLAVLRREFLDEIRAERLPRKTQLQSAADVWA